MYRVGGGYPSVGHPGVYMSLGYTVDLHVLGYRTGRTPRTAPVTLRPDEQKRCPATIGGCDGVGRRCASTCCTLWTVRSESSS